MNRGTTFALASAILFGVSMPLAKALAATISPLLLAGLLYAGSGIGLALVMAIRRVSAHGSLVAVRRIEEWRWLAAAIFFGGVLGPAALMYGLLTSAASTASLLLNLEAVFTALLAWFLFKENFDRRIALGMAAIVGGGALLAWGPGQRTGASPGLLLVAAACFCWALDNNLTRKVSGADAVMVACLKGLVAGTVNISLALLLGSKLPTLPALGAAALVGFAGYGVSLVLFVLSLRHLGAARTSAYFSVAPFCGAALSLLLAGEPMTWRLVAAGILMAMGVWLHLTERHEHLHRHTAQEHSHPHIHDEHHQHSHDLWDGTEPHTHPHRHVPLVHAHPHYPDLHHRHH